jgi:hypothetical protein
MSSHEVYIAATGFSTSPKRRTERSAATNEIDPDFEPNADRPGNRFMRSHGKWGPDRRRKPESQHKVFNGPQNKEIYIEGGNPHMRN